MIAKLVGGGAERVMSLLASSWSERGDEVTLVTLDAAPPFYPLHEAVRLDRLDRMGRAPGVGRLASAAGRLGALRRAVRRSRPDVCVSFVDRLNVPVLWATRGLGVPVVVSERVHPGFVDDRVWRTIRRVSYMSANAVVAQTERTASALRTPFGPRVVAIPNPVTEVGGLRASLAGRRVVAAGRLVPQKGFDVLLQAFASSLARHPGWTLHVYGEGPLRNELEVQARRLGISDAATFEGRTNRLLDELATADVFVLSSRFEGFPNVLCEAMAVGLPCVATRCLTGPEEIIDDGEDGMLVPVDDAAALSGALDALLGSAEERARLGTAAAQVSERLGLESILARWDEVFDRVVHA